MKIKKKQSLKYTYKKQRTDNSKDEWITPKALTDALGPFDLDPCSPINRPWDTATKHYTINDDGFKSEWKSDDFVWLNPPYGKESKKWLEKLAGHNRGIALLFVRTDTKMFFDSIWDRASCLYFIKGRLKFCNVEGIPQDPAPAASVLCGYGARAQSRLARLQGRIAGKFILL